MKKYQKMLFDNLERQLQEWLEHGNTAIPSEDVRRFLHSAAGTAGTIGLPEITGIASGLMRELDDKNEDDWMQEDLRRFLLGFITAVYALQGKEISPADRTADHAVNLSPDAPIVLLLDDDYTFVIYLKEELERRGYMVLTAADLSQALHYVHDYKLDAMIIDLHLKNGNGFDMLRSLADKLASLFIPVTIVSADDTKGNRLEAYRLGADDFVAKPLDVEELCGRLDRQLRRKEVFDRLLTRDLLTGAYRDQFAAEIHRDHLEDLKTGQAPFFVALIDIDDLRRINTERGYGEGDRLLVSLAKWLQSQLTRADRLIRYRGGQFLIYFKPPADREGASVLTEWLKGFENTSGFNVSLSGGVAEVSDPGQTFEQALEMAIHAVQTARTRKVPVIGSDHPANLPQAPEALRAAIVDDDAVVRTMLQEYVKSCFPPGIPLEVRVFRDGEEFINDPWSRDSVPCFVILDRMMPRMDGIEVLMRLRQSRDSERYTVLMLTNRKSDTDIVKALEMGADDYVTKPFSLKELEARIRRLSGKMV